MLGTRLLLMANNSDAKNGKLLPFVLPSPRPDVHARNVTALVFAFDQFQKARLARQAATPPYLKVKDDRRQKR